MKKCACSVCENTFAEKEVLPSHAVRSTVIETACNKIPSFNGEGYICFGCLRNLRALHIEEMLCKERGELSRLERDVVNSIKEHEIFNKNMNKKFETTLSFGERIADRIAHFGGSWTFILSFVALLVIWMAINTFAWINTFDPYPFILLNLVLSCLAAIQAPVIMMSQNRQASKDRLVNDYEYSVNLKAELEIRQLHSKLDQFTKNQWERHLELQQIQLELSEELLEALHSSKPKASPGDEPPEK